MGFWSKLAKGIENSLEKELENSIAKTSGVNVKAEVSEYDREIQNLERELEELEKREEEYEEMEYKAIARDIKQEINLCKRIKRDILREIWDEYSEEQRERYRDQLDGVSDSRLEKIANDTKAPRLLREVAKEKLDW